MPKNQNINSPLSTHTNSHAKVTPFFDADTSTFAYIVKDKNSSSCAIIDSVLGFTARSGCTDFAFADAIIAYVHNNDLSVEWHLETHVHADHLSAAPYLQEKLGGKIAISEHINTVQETFGKIFNEGSAFARDGSQFDKLLTDNETINIGSAACRIMATPGHTPACLTFIVGDAAFVGDTLFMPDYGTARCDFPGGSADHMYDSIHKIFALPEDTHMYMCHDYPKSAGRDTALYLTSVGEQKSSNKHIKIGVTKAEYVALREARDATLNKPKLILPSLQVNMRAGHFPAPESNGLSYLKIPVNAFK